MFDLVMSVLYEDSTLQFFQLLPNIGILLMLDL